AEIRSKLGFHVVWRDVYGSGERWEKNLFQYLSSERRQITQAFVRGSSILSGLDPSFTDRESSQWRGSQAARDFGCDYMDPPEPSWVQRVRQEAGSSNAELLSGDGESS